MWDLGRYAGEVWIQQLRTHTHRARPRGERTEPCTDGCTRISSDTFVSPCQYIHDTQQRSEGERIGGGFLILNNPEERSGSGP